MPHLSLSADEVLTTTRAVRKRLEFDAPVELLILRECLEIALQALHLAYEKEVAALLEIPDAFARVALIPIARTRGTAFKPAARKGLDSVLAYRPLVAKT